jgi:glyoxylate reductase
MRILYHNTRRADVEREAGVDAEYVDKETLLEQSDFISLHVPFNESTRHFIGARELAAMKRTAFLINTARGEVVDEKALVQALQDGLIAGAGLDVFENEPSIEPGLFQMENVVILPHIGSASIETRTRMGLVAAENLIALLVDGAMPPNCLNPEIFD